MNNVLKKRLLSVGCALTMLFSHMSSTLSPISSYAETQLTETAADENGLCHQSLEIYPNGEEAEQVITLEGLMPEGAAAEAQDVSAEHDCIAAYDITIMNGSDEFQPIENEPVFVEITDPAICDQENISVWHIKDNGEREEVSVFDIGDGCVSFYASGFSVYEIVKDENVTSDKSEWQKISSLDQLTALAASGLYISSKNGFYFSNATTSTSNPTRIGITKIKPKATSPPSGAVPYYFEKIDGTDNQFCVYCYNGNEKQYVYNNNNNSLSFTDESNKTVFTVSYDSNNGFRFNNNSWYWNMQGGDNGSRFCSYNTATDENNYMSIWYSSSVDDDPYQLDGKTYGLMNYTGGTHGYALMNGGGVHSLVELITHKTADADGITLYVDEGSEVTRWTFHSVGGDRYTLGCETDIGTKYLAITNDELTLADTAESAAQFKVTPDDQGRIQLSSNGRYITFVSSGSDDDPTYDFVISSAASGSNTLLSFIKFADLDDTDLITYSADRISVSKIENGQKVIVYTRIWDDEKKKYDMYAIDYNGTLYPCYASGGKILWLGDGTGSLEWIFNEYYHEVTKEPNYYYDLYNPYSEKYIAPQLYNNQVLSEEKPGINMPGRRNGEFYTDIIAWDNDNYTYIGMRPNEDKTRLVPCSQSTSVPFYFATLEELNLSDRLHPVPTVDNSEHGITMKMFNFDGIYNQLADTEITKNYFGGDFSNKQGLLENELVYTTDSSGAKDTGYPTIKANGKSFRDMYANAKEVNHLFLESVYNSSGYFEFDSCQNFATLNGKDSGNFTVYREIGTTNAATKPTLQHGQFFPYNTIQAGKYSSNSPYNLYDMDALASNNNIGKLDESDPRKYEKLHLINNPDYFFGMEMSAGFVQTVSGLDAWGHDIIFDFTGDDDFWLYVDGELVIDLGGTHSAEHGRVNFRTGEVVFSLVDKDNKNRTETRTTLKEIFRNNYEARGETDIDSKLDEIFEDNGRGGYIFKDYTSHTMRIFYMERGAGASNLHMRFNLASVTPGHVVVSKNITGNDSEVLDKDFVEYPFQIYYTLPEGEDGTEGEEMLLGNDDEHIRVTYQNSNQPVTFVKKYRPPGFSDEDAYRNIYFINPLKNAEISFPDETISYRIVECAVDSTVYDTVKINGEDVPEGRIQIKGNLRSYGSDKVNAEQRPTITFDNHVNNDVIKDLRITKKLLDENDMEITDDPTTFDFRLYLSSVDTNADDIPPANLYNYCVIYNDKLCRYDSASGSFVPTELTYSREVLKAISAYSNDDPDDDEIWETYDSSHSKSIASYGLTDTNCIFRTSPHGSISKIPSGYTVLVPNLPVGTIFKVTEDVKTGYGLVGYECVFGDKTNEDNTITAIPSYHFYEGNPANVGKVIADESPKMEVHNKKGYGLTVKKKWSDLDLTTYHAPVYVAVYADGELLADTVKQLASPTTSTYYFWTSLKNNADGTARTDMDGYEVREVLVSGDISIDSEGKVTGYDTVTPLAGGGEINLTATRTSEATPEGEDRNKIFDYTVSYEKGTANGSSRTDTIVNTRKGGIAVRLFNWASDEPLSGGQFTLKDSSGKLLGTYTSNSDGIVTMMYSFDKNEVYTLAQKTAPKGYVGLQKQLCFKVNNDDTISLYYSSGTEDWGSIDSYDKKWANWKTGENGITASVDIYNKQFNFKIVKVDSDQSPIKLGGAHFALYKQANTTISGYVKNKDPMTGFEDLQTVNGEVNICGGSSGRVIDPGEKGAVYFLTETAAPPNYNKLDEDIIFKISPIGVPTMISDSYNGQLVETENSYIYTLSVPNVKNTENVELTIKKFVSGEFGNKDKEFSFTLSINNADDSDEFFWSKNGQLQPSMNKNGSFTMKHNDVVIISVPPGTDITVTEDNEDYNTSFRLGSGGEEKVNTKRFIVTEPTELIVTNSISGMIPTGVSSSFLLSFAAFILPIAPICYIMRNRRRKREDT